MTPVTAVWPRDETDLVRTVQGFRVEGRRGRGRPKLTAEKVARADMIVCGIDGSLAEDRRACKAEIRRPNAATGGIRA